ncbi:MAG TPA: DUF3667 domain-containing protein [Steroidobacteraceae bacterium]|nr:DUF3667 domain-containing protein [Steroidobacteraceae bacterium]
MSSHPVSVGSAEVASPAAVAPEIPQAQTRVCDNCGAALAGEFCSACGQRHEPHVHTLAHFVGEAFESVTHADSRLWRTLGYLLVRPGYLTLEFFRGRRVRYLPPFRLNLVISLMFFVVAGLPNMEFEDEAPPTPESIAKLNQAAADMEKNAATTPGLEYAAEALRKKAALQQSILDGTAPKNADGTTLERSDRIENSLCSNHARVMPDAGWREQVLQGMCQRINHMTGRQLMEAVVHNIPRAMFVLLPLLALIMMLLYWRPKRYYVEHLLFLVHNHCFVFLALLGMILVGRLTFLGGLVTWLEIGLWLYLFWYIFRAMRVHYGQARWMTFAKYVIMGFAYIATSMLVLAGTVLYSAITL